MLLVEFLFLQKLDESKSISYNCFIMENMTLYQYITEHLDPEDQNYTEPTLPDEPFPTVPHPLGSEDAFWFASAQPPYVRGAEDVLKLLKEYIKYPDHVRKQKLYQYLADQPFIAILEPLSEKLANEDMTEVYYNLARSFFYNAKHRGPIKFAYLLLGIYGMDRIEEEDAVFYDDLVKVAQCEEFTYAFTFACEIGNCNANKAMWRIIGCTEGWGKVFAIEKATCTDEAQELWLIQHGMELSVDYPPLCRHIMEVSNVSRHLAEPEIAERTFLGAMVLVNAFLVTLDNCAETVLEETVNTAKLKPELLLQSLIRHAQVHADKPERILQVINLRMGIENLLENEQVVIIGYNEGQQLMADCDSIIYARDWQEYVADNLIKKDEINYELCDYACEIDMDIWSPLFDFFCEHPYEYKLLPYLFSYNDESYQQMTLHAVEHNLDLYQSEESALLVPLRYLAHNPGLGEQIIIAALHSMYDWPRGVACSVLNDWGLEYIDETYKQALREARDLSHNPVVTARIDALLSDRYFTMEDAIGAVEN